MSQQGVLLKLLAFLTAFILLPSVVLGNEYVGIASNTIEPSEIELPLVTKIAPLLITSFDGRCENLYFQIQQIRSHFHYNNELIVEKSAELSEVTGIWYKTLSDYEGKARVFPPETFMPVKQTSIYLNETYDAISTIARSDESFFEEAAFLIGECDFYSENIEERLFLLMSMAAEHLDTSAIYLSQIQGFIDSWAKRWSAWEDKSVIIPNGEFEPIYEASESFSEASMLIKSNAEAVLSEIDLLLAEGIIKP